jgi:hypothetical protein
MRRLGVVLLFFVVPIFGAPRRRAVRPGPCSVPSVSIAFTSATVCPNEVTGVYWTASDPRSIVTIPGIGSGLPSSGTRAIQTTTSTTYTATAANGCGTGQASSATLTIRPSAFGSLDVAASSISQGSTTTVTLTTSAATSWFLTSTIGNAFSLSSGSTGGTFQSTYFATYAGNDTIGLTVRNECGSSPLFSRSVSVVSSAPPPSSGGYLRCCDGTFSPTCTSCANKQGCCSHHNGVCGCP